MEQKIIKIETTNINKARSIISRIFAVFLVISLLLSTTMVCFAQEEAQEKTPLTELSKCENFNVEDFKEDSTDYSFKVIQIAETNEGKLNIYTFQPARNTVELRASSVNISYGFSSNGEGLTPKNYTLRLVSTEGCFDKYEVEDFDVRGDEYRYYNIVSIYRRLSEDVPTDENIVGGITNEKAYEVGQQWSVHTINDVTSYKMNTFMTKTIDQTHHGYLYYPSGLKLNNVTSSVTGGLYAWYVAFNIEDTIAKHIYNATLTFRHRQVEDVRVGGDYKDGYPKYTDWVTEENYPITDIDEVTYSQIGWFGDDFQWNRIMSSTEYIANAKAQGVNLSAEAEAEILKSQWVFSYFETEYRYSEAVGFQIQTTRKYSEVEKLSVLTLKYMDMSNNVYDVGIVSDITTADDVVDGYAQGMLGLQDKIKEIMEIITLVLGLLGFFVLVSFFPPLLNIVTTVFKVVIDIIIIIVSIPIKLIGSIFRKK